MATEGTEIKTANVQEALSNLGQNRKMVLIGAGVVTLILTLIIVFFVWSRGTSKGNELELVKRINQDRAFEIVSKLKAEEIDTSIDDSDLPGKVNVKVYEKDFDKAAITLARSDLLQEDGFNLFDKSDWAASDYDKRVKMARAVNGDLSRIVSRMTGIKWAVVRVNVPEPQLFAQFQTATTATVQVESQEQGAKLSRSQVRSVINLLVGYVPNLQNNNISIIDTNGQTYSAVETEEIAASELLEETERVNKIVQNKIEEYLEPLLGLNNYIVRVSSEISRKKIEESATTFAEGVVGQEQVGDERLGAGAEGAPAVGPALPGVEGNKNYIRSNRVTQKYPSYKQKTVSTPPGRITKFSVAVAINSDLPARVSIKQIREGIAAITSPNTIVDDVKITVAEFATGKPLVKAPAAKLKIAVPGFDFNSYISQIVEYFKKMPRWASITIAIFGLLLILSSFRRSAPVQTPGPSTISQINQSMQKQLQRTEAQIPMGQEKLEEALVPEIAAKQPDLTGILTGLQEAAVEKPEYLASKLQVWLEEGSKTSV